MCICTCALLAGVYVYIHIHGIKRQNLPKKNEYKRNEWRDCHAFYRVKSRKKRKNLVSLRSFTS